MNNYEYIKNCNLTDMAHFFCGKMEIVFGEDSCRYCPVDKKCFPEGYSSFNGFKNWLEEDYEKE